MIDSCSFGEIVIDGVKYTSDVIILPGGVIPNWRRKEGHSLIEADLAKVFDSGVTTLVVGAGYSGMMRVADKTRKIVSAKGIELIVMKTKDACDELNRLSETGNVAGAFHLTC